MTLRRIFVYSIVIHDSFYLLILFNRETRNLSNDFELICTISIFIPFEMAERISSQIAVQTSGIWQNFRVNNETVYLQCQSADVTGSSASQSRHCSRQ